MKRTSSSNLTMQCLALHFTTFVYTERLTSLVSVGIFGWKMIFHAVAQLAAIHTKR